MRFFTTFVFFLITTCVLISQTVAGTWKTIDDETNEAKSYVEISIENGKAIGKISKLLLSPADSVCKKCKKDKKNKPLVGMEIISPLKKDGEEWNGGKILDPESGKTYNCSIWLEGEELRVRGKHWTGLYRTQTWYRVE